MSTSGTKLHQVGLVTRMIIHTSLQIDEDLPGVIFSNQSI